VRKIWEAWMISTDKTTTPLLHPHVVKLIQPSNQIEIQFYSVQNPLAAVTGMKAPQCPNGSLQVSMNLKIIEMTGEGKPFRSQILKKKCMQTLD
jgi:hypothetical protein